MKFGNEVLNAIVDQLQEELKGCSSWMQQLDMGAAISFECGPRCTTDMCSYMMVVAGDELLINWGMTSHRLDLLRHDSIPEFVASDLLRWKDWVMELRARYLPSTVSST